MVSADLRERQSFVENLDILDKPEEGILTFGFWNDRSELSDTRMSIVSVGKASGIIKILVSTLYHPIVYKSDQPASRRLRLSQIFRNSKKYNMNWNVCVKCLIRSIIVIRLPLAPRVGLLTIRSQWSGIETTVDVKSSEVLADLPWLRCGISDVDIVGSIGNRIKQVCLPTLLECDHKLCAILSLTDSTLLS